MVMLIPQDSKVVEFVLVDGLYLLRWEGSGFRRSEIETDEETFEKAHAKQSANAGRHRGEVSDYHRDVPGRGAPDLELVQQSHGCGLARGRDCVEEEERLYSVSGE
jgi:hypothetical protein